VMLLICGGAGGQAFGMCSTFLLGSVFVCAGAQPYLGARIVSGDEMIDGVLSPRVCGRSVYGGRPASGALAAGALRELAARHRSDDGQAHDGWLGGGVDELRSRQVGRGECVVAEFAQDVVGAPAEFARDGEAGAVVVDPFCDLEVVGVVG
jgi:hypothetical protein